MSAHDTEIQFMMGCGIDRAIAEEALPRYGYDASRALNMILNGTFAPSQRSLVETSRPEQEDSHEPAIELTRPIENVRSFDFEYVPLPAPVDSAEFRRRIAQYVDARELRKVVLAIGTLEGFERARELHADAYRLIGFVHLHSLQELQAIDSAYSDEDYESDLRKNVIILRKIAESCYYVNHLDDGIRICNLAISAAGHRLRCITWFVYGVLCRIHTERGEFDLANEAIVAAFALKPDSNILSKARANLRRGRVGLPLNDGPEFLRRHGSRTHRSRPNSELILSLNAALAQLPSSTICLPEMCFQSEDFQKQMLSGIMIHGMGRVSLLVALSSGITEDLSFPVVDRRVISGHVFSQVVQEVPDLDAATFWLKFRWGEKSNPFHVQLLPGVPRSICVYSTLDYQIISDGNGVDIVQVVMCDGSEDERFRFLHDWIHAGSFIRSVELLLLNRENGILFLPWFDED